jgi:hypothetical protein
MNYTTRILLHPLLLVVNTDDAVPAETYPFVKDTDGKKEILSTSLNKVPSRCNIGCNPQIERVLAHVDTDIFSCSGTYMWSWFLNM